MNTGRSKQVRCAIYTRVSSDQGLEQDFNSLDAQYDASQAYIRSQQHARWAMVRSKYMMMEAFPAAIPTARRCSGYLRTCEPGRSISSWSTRLTD
jgi:hypothetical protein